MRAMSYACVVTSGHVTKMAVTPFDPPTAMSNFNHCDVIGQQSNRIRLKQRKIRAITPFKLTSYLEPFRGYRSLLFKFWTLCVFESLWGLRDNVRWSSWAHWKARRKLPSVSGTFFARCYGWGVIDRKSAFWKRVGQYCAKFSRIKGRPHQLFFCTDSYANECLTIFSLTVFTQRNFVADFLQVILHRKRPFCVFEPLMKA